MSAAPKHNPRVVVSSAQAAVRVPRKKVIELVAFVGRAEGVRLGEIDVAVVDAGQIASLNRQWLRHAGPTDVLSFDLSDAEKKEGLCAQIVVCGDVAAVEGPRRGTSATRELLLYVTHGLLHLMGYDDVNVRAGAKMHAREDELLRAFLAKR